MVELTLPAIDFKRDKTDIPATVQRIVRFWKYPIPLAEVKYADGETRHILAPVGLQPGDTVLTSENAPLKPGNVLPLKSIPPGIMIHNVERQPGRGGQLVRSAGSAAQVAAKEDGLCIIQLPSGRTNTVSIECRATIGRLSHVSQEKLRPLEPKAADETALQPEQPPQQEQNDADLGSDRVDINTAPGEYISFNIIARNTGNSTWAAEKGYRLGWLLGYDYFTFKKRLKLDFDSRENITPGSIKIWHVLDLSAPQETGNYALIWQMCQGESRWFGKKLNIRVKVKVNKENIAAEKGLHITPDAAVKDDEVNLIAPKSNPDRSAKQQVRVSAARGARSRKAESAIPTKTGQPKSKKAVPPPAEIVNAGEIKPSTKASDMQAELPNVEEKKIKGVMEPQLLKMAPAAQEKTLPLVIVQPPIGPSKTKFKVAVSRCTPKRDIILSYETYAIGSGWKIENKKLGTNKAGVVAANISWNQAGTYDVWVKDISSGLESQVARVVVL